METYYEYVPQYANYDLYSQNEWLHRQNTELRIKIRKLKGKLEDHAVTKAENKALRKCIRALKRQIQKERMESLQNGRGHCRNRHD
eukprot:UN01028